MSPRTSSHPGSGSPRKSGQDAAALILTLLLLVLVSGLVVILFDRVKSAEILQNAAQGGPVARTIAAGAADTIASDLRLEMMAGSERARWRSDAVLKPVAGAEALWEPIPQLPGGVNLPPTGWEQLIKQSTAAARFFPSSAPMDGSLSSIPAASGISTTDPSLDRKSVALARWDRPRLAEGRTTAATAPEWVYLGRSGVLEDQTFNPAWKDPNSIDRPIGRFAYRVYDISGLLDINVAGFPSGFGTRALEKGSLAWANLGSDVGNGIGRIVERREAFLRWRNSGSLGKYDEMTDDHGRNTGFLRHLYGDRRFSSRQDLIHFAERPGSPIRPEVLPYLTIFTRTQNAPNWSPETPAGSTVDYANRADDPRFENRWISRIVVRRAFTRRDGRSAAVGEPLVDRRFPLAAIDLLTHTGQAAGIRQFFGLRRDNPQDPWRFDFLNGGIPRLAQVANLQREPNFFELLKAAILRGSLAKSNDRNSSIGNLRMDRSLDRQILQIGANLIDQYDSDDIPTVISTDGLAANASGRPVIGIENHPFISAMYQHAFRRRDIGPENSLNPDDPLNPRPWLNGFFQFQLWNPHINANTAPGGEYRIVASGQLYLQLVKREDYPNQSDASDRIDSEIQDITGSALYFHIWGQAVGGLRVTEPRLLNSDRVDVSQTPSENLYTHGGAKIAGVSLGTMDASSNLDGDGDNTNDYESQGSVWARILYISGQQPKFRLEWKSPSGHWVPIQEIGPFANAILTGGGNPTPFETEAGTVGELRYDAEGLYKNAFATGKAMVWSDPRTLRFGMHATSQRAANGTIRPQNFSPPYGRVAWGHFNVNSPQWNIDPTLQSKGHYAPAELAENLPSSRTFVADRDGVVRPGDGNPTENLFAQNQIARPYLLNRPFRSVAELAYTSRDDPWKSLDFRSATSADAGLLDVFSTTNSAVQAGVLNLNSAPLPVIRAVLSRTRLDPGRNVGELDADAAAQRLYEVIQASPNPIQNRGQLTQVIAAAEDALPPLKRQQEAVARALADVLNLRTWNVFVDVIAQSGSFPDRAANAADFLVDGESRLWMHLAIDRVTGRIIDVKRERVDE